MLNLASTDGRARAGTRADERRNSRRFVIAARRLILPRGVAAGETRVEVIGATDGTVGTVMFGGGGGGIRAALPTPLGSLTELFRPPALPGPRMPLTPASCAGDIAGAARLAARAKTRVKNVDLPIMATLQRECTNESRGLTFLGAEAGRFGSGARRRYLPACVAAWRSAGECADASASTQACGLTRSPAANF